MPRDHDPVDQIHQDNPPSAGRRASSHRASSPRFALAVVVIVALCIVAVALFAHTVP